MEQLIAVARQLGMMNIFNVTLEVDYPDLMRYKQDVEGYIKSTGTTIEHKEKFEGQYPPQVFIKLHGIKMLIVCRNVSLESK